MDRLSGMKILVLGGSRFLGRAYVADALSRGHEVTTFNRGVSGADLDRAEAVRGDRTRPEDLERLVDGRRWDAVVDTSGQQPYDVAQSVRLLRGRAGHYSFVSSVHAFADWPAKPVDEDSDTLECPADTLPTSRSPPPSRRGSQDHSPTGTTAPRTPGTRRHREPGRAPWCHLQIGRAQEPVGALDLGHVHRERGVPVLAPVCAGQRVLRVTPPGRDRLLVAPVRHRDSQTVRAARRIDAEEARLVGSQFQHLLRPVPVALVTSGPYGGEHHRVVGRGG